MCRSRSRPSIATAFLVLLPSGCYEPSAPEPGPLPVIESVSPGTVWIASADTTIAVRGQQLNSTSVVEWNGQPLATDYAAPDGKLAIVADVPRELVQEPGNVSLTVFNPGTDSVGDARSDPFLLEVSYQSPSARRFQPVFLEPHQNDATVIGHGEYFTPATEGTIDSVPVDIDVLDCCTVRVRVPGEFLATDGVTIGIGFSNPGTEARTRNYPVFERVAIGSAGGERLGHACVVDAGGVLRCWKPWPRPLRKDLRFDALYASTAWSHNQCARAESGELYCWGYGSSGQLGHGTVDSTVTTEPTVPVADGHRFVDVAVGAYHVCAVDADGAAWCWGRNDYGQLGTGDGVDHSRPAPVAGSLRFSDIAAGLFHTCAIAVDGGAYCWGTDRAQALGNGPGEQDSAVPAPVSSDLLFAKVAAADEKSCALTDDGTAYCWGSNHVGELGLGHTESADAPQPMAGDLRFSRLALGYSHSCGITTTSIAYCWGAGPTGQLGTGQVNVKTSTPVAVGDGHRWSEIHVDREVTCGLTTRRGFYCWGWVAGIWLVEPRIDCDGDPTRNGLSCHPLPTGVYGVR